MNPEMLYASHQLERQMSLKDPSAAHWRALRPRQLPWHERMRSLVRTASTPRRRRARPPLPEPRAGCVAA
jgi:hypothetical protein